MKFKNVHLTVAAIAILILFFAASIVSAGVGVGVGVGTSTSQEGSSIVGPEVRAVVVINCSGNGDKLTTLRAKRIVDYGVQTEALTFFVPNCPRSERDILDSYLLDLTLFDLPNPFVTEVKNFKIDSKRNVCSFDAQIKFAK